MEVSPLLPFLLADLKPYSCFVLFLEDFFLLSHLPISSFEPFKICKPKACCYYHGFTRKLLDEVLGIELDLLALLHLQELGMGLCTSFSCCFLCSSPNLQKVAPEDITGFRDTGGQKVVQTAQIDSEQDRGSLWRTTDAT